MQPGVHLETTSLGDFLLTLNGRVAHLVEHRFETPGVAGSIPAPTTATNARLGLHLYERFRGGFISSRSRSRRLETECSLRGDISRNAHKFVGVPVLGQNVLINLVVANNRAIV